MSSCNTHAASGNLASTNLIFSIDDSGESSLTPIIGEVTLRLVHVKQHYRLVHHSGYTTYRTSSSRALKLMADTINNLADTLPHNPVPNICA